jgi:aldehyde:ferredoxin oxidoreductase
VLGRNLRFGDAGRLVELVAEMGEGTGFGAELADGSARFAARYEHPDAAMHVKGLELPAYDPRGMHGQGLAYATSNRGACHLRGNMLGPEILGIPKLIDRFASEGKSGILLNLQHLSAVFDSLCACKFTGFAFGEEILARLLSATTGDRVGAQDLLRIGERVWNLERLWNMAAGFTRGDDTLPARVLAEPLTDGPAAGRALELEPMLAEYYRARGWGADGRPGAEKIASLGLEEQAARLRDVAVEPGTLLPWQDWRPAVLEEPCEPAGDGSGGPSDDSPDGPGSARKESRHLRAV